ncbi:myosin heavy chain [Acrasis kona]|uniref:Myosin heavy chain n=1 Tax=Acrasis kona TaxID=1008807 RepID=A0AAW2YYB5_9EUKA
MFGFSDTHLQINFYFLFVNHRNLVIYVTMAYSAKKKQAGVDDMVLISKLKDEEVMENLKKRHATEVIYTYISNVLISVNPYKALPIFGPDQVQEYRGKFRHELPPHIYALAESAYKSLTSEGENQCVIISGESGAGKTEASKLIMQYVAAVSGKGEGVERVKRIILDSNPLLEAFGNAKTLRNNNSSRFGKYFEIQFDNKGDPVGGKITNYLLEKSRVIMQTQGERNFHIFYQLCAGADQSIRDEYGISQASDYHYLNQSGCYTVDNIDDASEYNDTIKAMDTIGINAHQRKEILKLVAGILWLGNISFVESGTGSEISDPRILDFASDLLGIQSQVLKDALLFRIITTGFGKTAEVFNVPQTPDQATHIRDGLAKTLYDRLFTWLVGRINDSMDSKNQDVKLLSVLDIYGFEIFDKNGFEQFCINYVNEKLQQIFIELTLKAEQEEYAQEGIQWEPIKYFNNQVVVDLIESSKPKPGIFAILDDTCATTHALESNVADNKLLTKLKESIDNDNFVGRNDDFIVKHYAGNVTYSVDGFTDKNKDQLYNTLIECMQSSTMPFVKQFFPENTREASGKKPTTAGFKIKQSSLELIAALKKCQPHYIRCMKPNESKSSKEFDVKRMLHQVKYLGLLENIRVRRAGYAYRQIYDKFLERFAILSRKTWPSPFVGESKQGCSVLLKDLNIDEKEWQMGKTKMFLRSPETLFDLEERKEKKFYNSAALVQRSFRNFKLKNYFLTMRAEASQLYQNKKERRRLSLNRVFSGDHVNYLNNAQLVEVMKQYEKPEGGLLFTDVLMVPVKKLLRGLKLVNVFGMVTSSHLYVVERVLVKKQFVMNLNHRIKITDITSVGMSCLCDNWLTICNKNENVDDLLLECENKTEFLAVLNDQYKALEKKPLQTCFDNKLTWRSNKKKKKVGQIEFVKDPKHKLALLTAAGNKYIVNVAEGLSPASQPRTIVRPERKRAANAGGGLNRSQSIKKTGAGLQSSLPMSPNIHNYQSPNEVVQPHQQKLKEQQLDVIQEKKESTVQVKSTANAPSRPPPLPRKTTDNRPKLRAAYGYDATAGDELTLKEGDLLYLIEKDPSGWWEGELIATGKRGLFPGNYVQEL